MTIWSILCYSQFPLIDFRFISKTYCIFQWPLILVCFRCVVFLDLMTVLGVWDTSSEVSGIIFLLSSSFAPPSSLWVLSVLTANVTDTRGWPPDRFLIDGEDCVDEYVYTTYYIRKPRCICIIMCVRVCGCVPSFVNLATGDDIGYGGYQNTDQSYSLNAKCAILRCLKQCKKCFVCDLRILFTLFKILKTIKVPFLMKWMLKLSLQWSKIRFCVETIGLSTQITRSEFRFIVSTDAPHPYMVCMGIFSRKFLLFVCFAPASVNGACLPFIHLPDSAS